MSEKTPTSMVSYGILVLVLFAAGFMIYAVLTSVRYGHALKDTTSTRGMNGTSGQTVQLQCPAGQVISFNNTNTSTTRGALTCSDSDSGTCDAYWSTEGQFSNFFTTNIVDALDSSSPFTDLTDLVGQNAGSWSIPLPSDSRLPAASCIRGCSSLNFIGTYDCVAA